MELEEALNTLHTKMGALQSELQSSEVALRTLREEVDDERDRNVELEARIEILEQERAETEVTKETSLKRGSFAEEGLAKRPSLFYELSTSLQSKQFPKTFTQFTPSVSLDEEKSLIWKTIEVRYYVNNNSIIIVSN